uniref:Uncharacterized protein n=1 Tax=Arundo donax TaxID=35708 RepID=A0A0A9BNI2_ARUDO
MHLTPIIRILKLALYH